MMCGSLNAVMNIYNAERNSTKLMKNDSKNEKKKTYFNSNEIMVWRKSHGRNNDFNIRDD